MKILVAVLIIAMPVLPGLVHAEEKTAGAAASKPSTCNKDAGDRTGDDRKAFMKACQKRESDEKKALKDKNKACKHESASRTGEERKAFMKECMSK